MIVIVSKALIELTLFCHHCPYSLYQWHFSPFIHTQKKNFFSNLLFFPVIFSVQNSLSTCLHLRRSYLGIIPLIDNNKQCCIKYILKIYSSYYWNLIIRCNTMTDSEASFCMKSLIKEVRQFLSTEVIYCYHIDT